MPLFMKKKAADEPKREFTSAYAHKQPPAQAPQSAEEQVEEDPVPSPAPQAPGRSGLTQEQRQELVASINASLSYCYRRMMESAHDNAAYKLLYEDLLKRKQEIEGD